VMTSLRRSMAPMRMPISQGRCPRRRSPRPGTRGPSAPSAGIGPLTPARTHDRREAAVVWVTLFSSR